MSDSFVPFDMEKIYADQRRCEEQMLEAKCRQIEFDCLMQQMQAVLMVANYNMTALMYASLNPNLDDAALQQIFGAKT